MGNFRPEDAHGGGGDRAEILVDAGKNTADDGGVGRKVFEFFTLLISLDKHAGIRLGEPPGLDDQTFRHTHRLVRPPCPQVGSKFDSPKTQRGDVIVEAGEVEPGGDARFQRPVSKIAFWEVGQQPGKRIHGGLPRLRRRRPIPGFLGGLSLDAMGTDRAPSLAAQRGLASLGQLVHPPELGVPHVPVTRDEIGLAFDGLVEFGGGRGELPFGEQLLSFRLQGATLPPERRGLKPTQACLEAGATAGFG